MYFVYLLFFPLPSSLSCRKGAGGEKEGSGGEGGREFKSLRI